MRFTAKDPKQFKDEEVIAALKQKGIKYSSGAKRLVGLTVEEKKDEEMKAK